MDRLQSMRVLLAAVDACSLSAASRLLGIPLATVSRKVSELESHLGTELLIRTNRRLALSDPGRAYVDACRRILADIDLAERVAAGEYKAPQGELVISSPIVFGRLHLLPVVTDFMKTYPEVDVVLDLTDRVVDLVEDHADLVLRIGELPESRLVARQIGFIRRIACASPGYLAARGEPSHPADISSAPHDCVTFNVLQAPRNWMFQIGDKMQSFDVRSRLVVGTAEAAIDAAIQGLGITSVFCYQAKAALADGKLVRILREFEPAGKPVNIVYRGQQHLPAKVRAFIDFAAPRLKAMVAGISD